MSSDAPYGDANPWSGVRAAATRDGPERVPETTALGSLLAARDHPAGPARRVQLGAAADLCLLTDALDEALARGAAAVRATFIAGRAIHVASGRLVTLGSHCRFKSTTAFGPAPVDHRSGACGARSCHCARLDGRAIRRRG
jgi:hypothetical protein